MRKLLTLLLTLTLAVTPLSASLTFGAASSDRVAVTANATIDDLSSFTMMMWVYATTQTSNRRWWYKGSASQKQAVWRNLDANDIEFNVARATTNALLVTSQNFSTNAWYFVAFTYDESDGPRMFFSTLTSSLAETSYASRTVGSGATSVDNGSGLFIGNRSSANAAFQGRIATVMYCATRLTQAEIAVYRWRMLPDAGKCDVRVFTHLGWAGTGTQPDLSGNGNNGTATGATVADHAPIARWP